MRPHSPPASSCGWAVSCSNPKAPNGAKWSTPRRSRCWPACRLPRPGRSMPPWRRPKRLSRPGRRRPSARARIFLKYQQLIREHMAELAALLTAEQGKTLADAEGDVFRGLEVVEHAAGIGNLQLG